HVRAAGRACAGRRRDLRLAGAVAGRVVRVDREGVASRAVEAVEGERRPGPARHQRAVLVAAVARDSDVVRRGGPADADRVRAGPSCGEILRRAGAVAGRVVRVDRECVARPAVEAGEGERRACAAGEERAILVATVTRYAD